MRTRIRRPSPAMVIAILALVMAMVGTGYAAFKLPKNSVGAKQIKKNAVTSPKVKNKTLTGKDINLNKLGTVPSATNAAHAISADTVASEPTHFIGAPGEPEFGPGSFNQPGEGGFLFPRAGFYKDPAGVVHLQGLVHMASGSFPVAFRLPPGFRPAPGTFLPTIAFCFAEAPASCESDEGSDEEVYGRILIAGSNVAFEGVDLSGDVLATSGTTISLDGISFRAES